MKIDPPETSELQAFVAVVDSGSVTGAARELALPRATISRRLARLEDRLDTRLMHRTTRRVQSTDAGLEYYRHARAILDAVELATRSVVAPDSAPRGLLRVSVPPVRGPEFHTLLLDFLEQYPAVQLEVIVSTAFEDLRARNIDVAWRAGTEFDPSLIARPLTRTTLLGVASPAYLQAHGLPASPADLAEHRCLVGFARGERPATHWPLHDGGQVRVRGVLSSNDLGLRMSALLRGMGIGLLPQMLMRDRLAEGSLVPVLEGVLGRCSQSALVYPDRHHLRPAVRAFVDHVVRWFTELDELVVDSL